MFGSVPVEGLPDRGERQWHAARRGAVQGNGRDVEVVGDGAVRGVSGVQVPVEHPAPCCRAVLISILGEGVQPRTGAAGHEDGSGPARSPLPGHPGEALQELAGRDGVRGDEGGDGRRRDVGTGQQAQGPENPRRIGQPPHSCDIVITGTHQIQPVARARQLACQVGQGGTGTAGNPVRPRSAARAAAARTAGPARLRRRAPRRCGQLRRTAPAPRPPGLQAARRG